MSDTQPEDLLDFWFAGTRQDPERIRERMGFWFRPTADDDAAVRERFQPLLEPAVRGHCTHWLDAPGDRLALILLLDQAPRVIHRRSARAFACDGQALAITLAGLDAAHDRKLSLAERAFFYMPLQHAEDRAVQTISLECYERLVADFSGHAAIAREFLGHARAHADIVQRFGRYPHRNELLGRESTQEELGYLEDAPRFGQ